MDSSRRHLAEYLESLQRAGVTRLPKLTAEQAAFLEKMASEPVSDSNEQPAEPEAPSSDSASSEPSGSPSPSPQPNVPRAEPVPAVPRAGGSGLFDVSESDDSDKTVPQPSTLSADERARELTVWAERVAACTRCPQLVSNRTQTVFGTGNPVAEVMFLGEAPGADEDRTGVPFVGQAGKLLTDIIHACKLTREEIYICNILRCRPPGNRNPRPEEAENCREYLDAQIRLVDPDWIICWGKVAAVNLLGIDRPIGKMRRTWFTHGRARVLCTYHPSYLLRNPKAKKPVWEDMKFWRADMGVNL